MAAAAGLLRAGTATGPQKARLKAALDLDRPTTKTAAGLRKATMAAAGPGPIRRTARPAAGRQRAKRAADPGWAFDRAPGPALGLGPAFGPGPMEAAGSCRPFQGGANGRALRLGDAPRAVKVHGNASGEVSTWPEIRRDTVRTLRVAAADTRFLLEAAERLPGFNHPALIIWASEDRVTPAEHGRRPAKLLPHGQLVEVENSYTLIPLDQPAGSRVTVLPRGLRASLPTGLPENRHSTCSPSTRYP